MKKIYKDKDGCYKSEEVEDVLVVYLSPKQLDDILSNRVSRMIPVIEHIRTTVQRKEKV